jgi:type II secretory pathway pseudopilin PulG
MYRGGISSGFTIIEVMIFLVITSSLFLIAINAISGRQAVVQFQLATRETNSKLTDIFTQVANGFYPNDNKVTCTAPLAGGPPVFANTAPVNGKGSSDGCVFLGKVVKFNNNSSDYNSISVASRRYAGGTTIDSSSFADALPRAVVTAGGVNINDNISVPNGIAVTCVSKGPNCTAGTSDGAIVFFGSFPNAAGNGNFASGSQHVRVGVLPGSRLTDSLNTTYTYISDLSLPATPNFLDLPSGVVVCLADLGTTRRVKISLGGTSGQLSTTMDVLQTGDSSCP